MQNPIDAYATVLRAERKRQNLTQQELAQRLHMTNRTIMDLENCHSSPRFETVAFLSKELNISLDAILFPETATTRVSESAADFFAEKSEQEIQKYIALCRVADTFRT